MAAAAPDVGGVRADATKGSRAMTTPCGPGPGQPDPGLAAIISERRQLINLACRSRPADHR
jgi:hypothetical protein